MKRPFFDSKGRVIDDGETAFLGVPRLTETFNRGLGCYTSGTRDAEKKAKEMSKRLGRNYIPIGNENVEKLFPKRDFKKEITPIIEEGIKQVRAKKIKDEKL